MPRARSCMIADRICFREPLENIFAIFVTDAMINIAHLILDCECNVARVSPRIASIINVFCFSIVSISIVKVLCLYRVVALGLFNSSHLVGSNLLLDHTISNIHDHVIPPV
jgi:hypothetical protein